MRSKPRSSKTFLGRTCIRSRKRKGFVLFSSAEGAGYTVEKIAARTGKTAALYRQALRNFSDLIPPVADALLAGHIGVEHALLIAKLASGRAGRGARAIASTATTPRTKPSGASCPSSRLQAWIEQNIYLSLKSVPFSKEDETLVPEAGSCANCPKRTGFNTLLFSEVREDSEVRRCRLFQSQARNAHRAARRKDARIS